MPSDPRFLEAWVNRCDHQVLGHRLHPLCLLDLVTLDALDSPFVNNAKPATLADFLVTVLVLSRDYETLEINPVLPEPSLRDRLRLRFCNFAKENAALQAYFDDYYSTLEMWRPDSDGKKCQAPWILGTVTFLLAHTNLEERRIWTGPIGQILCYANSLEEQVGSSQVVSVDELELMQQRRREAIDHVS